MRAHLLIIMISSLFMGIELRAQIPCNGEFLNTGSAVDVGNCIQLTSNTTGQQGCTWLNTPVDFTQPFTHTMVMNFGNNNAGADGICLVYQTGGPNQCGMTGGAIGAAGIPNSFIVEFDTWDNGAAQSDIAADHCATSIFGDLNNQVDPPVSLGDIEDGADHVVTFAWNPAGTSYVISFDGVPIISGVYDIINLVFLGNPLAYWGYTSSTGAAFNTQTVCPSLPPPITVDAGIDITVPCNDGLITLDATNTVFGATYLYSWSSPNGGVIVSGGGTLTPTVMGPGTYILTLTDTNGGCMETDEVVVGLNPLMVSIAPPPFVPCFGNTVFLDGTASSSGPFITYQWTTPDGSIVSGANSPTAEINAPGTYTLTVTYNDGNTICTEQASVQVFQDPNVPIAAAVGGIINCFFPTIQLDGSSSSSGPDYTYDWITSDGQILAGSNTPFPTVGAAGTYTIIVTNTFNGCFATFDVLVEEDTNPPVAVAIAEDSLGCQVEEVTLNGTGSTVGANITYEWSTTDGNIISGINNLTATVDQAGTYTLFVSNNGNGCFDSESVEVIGDAAGIVVAINPPDLLDCVTTQFELDASGSALDSTYSYSWTSTNGNIISGADGLSPLINAPGNYVLSIVSPDGCVGADSVLVMQDTLSPSAEAGNQQVLSCDETTLILDGTGSSTGNNISYQWTTTNGNLVAGSTTLMASINAPGTYTISVTNTDNNCTAVDTVTVLNDAQAPVVSILTPDTLNCTLLQQTLDASGSSQGLGFDISWTTTGGNIVSGQNTLQALINGGGQYTLNITNLNNNCTSMSSVFVVQDTISPTLAILTPDTLNCQEVAVAIDATASSTGNNFVYTWTTTDGNILGGEQTSSPQVDVAGTYELNITNTENGCQGEGAIEVAQDTVAPIVSLIVTDTLDCATDTITLDGTGSSQGAPYLFTWVAPNPTSISNTGGLEASASEGGDFGLIVVNTVNNCQSTAMVEVIQDTIVPIADAGPDRVVNCYNETLVLDGSNSSSSSDIVYQWSGTMVDAGANTTNPMVSLPGSYVLQLSNNANNCINTDTVLVTENFDEPLISIAIPDILTCTDSLIFLDATASSQGAIYEYEWTTDNGSIVLGANTTQSTVSQAGDYLLEIINTISGCSVQDSVQVIQDVNLPVANILQPATLSCDINSIQLDGSNSSQGNNISFQWTTSNGNISANNNTLMPTVDAPGTYNLQIVDTDNDCETVAVVNVPIDTIAPFVDAGPSQELNCSNTQLVLDGSGSTQGSNYNYQWSTTNGNILSGPDGLTPLIDATGQYTLSVFNTNNGCSNNQMVDVTEDFQIPYLEVAMPATLNCTNTIVALDATASETAPYISYIWTTSNGTLSGGADVLLSATTTPGQYQITIFNENNGCSDTAMVMVNQDTVEPDIQILPATVLTCNDTIQTLNTTGSSTGSDFEYIWTTLNGSIISGNTSPAPAVNAPGDYQLEILNTSNGCTSSASVNIIQNTELPQIGILSPQILTCDVLTADLEVSVSNSAGQNYAYNWSTSDGNILNGVTNALASVDSAGTYFVAVTDEENGCISTGDITVQQDITAPIVNISLPDTLNCAEVTVELDATASSNGFLFTNSWTTAAGVILNGANTLLPEIGQPGTYTLLIENTANGCEETGMINVVQDTVAPIVMINPSEPLTCTQTTAMLNGSGSSEGDLFEYLWDTDDGNIVGGEQELLAVVDEPGLYILSVQNLNNGCTNSETITLDQDILLPQLSIEAPEILSCATTVINLDGQDSSAGNEFEYLWTTDDGNILGANSLPVITANEPGTYTLSVVNMQNGCVDSLAIMVMQDIAEPEINIANPAVLTCAENQVLLDASGSSSGSAFSYNWTTSNGNLTGGINTPLPMLDAPGTYLLTISNTENGCSSSLSTEVQENTQLPEFVLLPTDTLTCAMQETAVTGVSTGSGESLTFLWQSQNGIISGPLDEISTTVVAPGEYTLIATDTENGCLDSLSIAVAQDTVRPEVQISSPGLLSCSIQDIILDASLSGIGTYDWTTDNGNILMGSNTPLPTINAPGVYTLTLVASDNGCSQSAEVQVDQDIALPVVSIASPDILTCTVGSVVIDAGSSSSGSEFEYAWDIISGGNFVSGEDSLTPVVNAPGLYEILIVNTENGCEQNAQVNISQDITPPMAEAGIDFVLPCFEPSTQLDGNGSSAGAQYTYTWTTQNGSLINGSNTLNPSVDAPGAYELLVINTSNGCSSVDEVIVVQEIPVAVADLIQPLCFGGLGSVAVSTVEGGVGPYVYSIDDGATLYSSPNFTGLPSGNYDIVVQDVNGCEYKEEVAIIQPDSTVVMLNNIEVDLLLGESHQIVLSTNLTDSEIAVINWSNVPGLSCYDCYNPIATPSQTTDYRVQVVSENGCTDEATIRIYVDKRADIYIPNIFSPNNDGANDIFYIFSRPGTVKNIQSFRIFNRWGEPMFEDFDFLPNDSGHGWDGFFRGELMNSGVFVYYAEIEFIDGRVELFKGDITLLK